MHTRTHRHELRDLLLLVGPILVTQLTQTANSFVDTLMAGQVSALDLAAVSMGAGLWLPVFLLVSGILLATTPLVANAWGAGRHGEIPGTIHQALWLAGILGCAGFLILRHTGPIMGLLHVPPHLQQGMQAYLEGISWGIPAVAAFFVLRCYSEGIGHPAPVMIISIIALLANIPLNYIFIHGLFGVPRLGGPGCGWATAIVFWLELVLMAGWVAIAPRYKGIRPGHGPWKPDAAIMWSVLKVGFPIGIAIFVEVSVFALAAILLSPLGEKVVAGHQIALNVASLLFMLPLSVAMAMTIRVGQAAGRSDGHGVMLTRRMGLMLILAVALLNATLVLSLRDSITGIYTTDASVRQLAMNLLMFAAFFQIFDALQVGASGMLRGLQDTRGPMQITLVAYWLVALPLGYALGMGILSGGPGGAEGLWTGLVIGLMLAAVLLNLRLNRALDKFHSGLKEKSRSADVEDK